MIHVESSLNLLRLCKGETDAIGVAVSFGKDSLATLDLCCRVFDRVEAFYLYRVAEMEIVAGWARAVKARYGVDVRMYPHFDLSRCYRNAVMQPHWKGTDKTPVIKMSDVEAKFQADANVEWMAYGWRRNDSFSRALIMRQCAGYDPKSRRVFPLRSWRRQDVYDYLAARKIKLPPGLGRKEQGGLDFHPAALAELKQKYPRDYARWVRDFPFSGIQSIPAAGQKPQAGPEQEQA
jgi:3'-phosphoadenosine 5'-phosphosulfate sulfotransferase (PAPS reductase)/FAD synthetase